MRDTGAARAVLRARVFPRETAIWTPKIAHFFKRSSQGSRALRRLARLRRAAHKAVADNGTFYPEISNTSQLD